MPCLFSVFFGQKILVMIFLWLILRYLLSVMRGSSCTNLQSFSIDLPQMQVDMTLLLFQYASTYTESIWGNILSASVHRIWRVISVQFHHAPWHASRAIKKSYRPVEFGWIWIYNLSPHVFSMFFCVVLFFLSAAFCLFICLSCSYMGHVAWIKLIDWLMLLFCEWTTDICLNDITRAPQWFHPRYKPKL